MFAVETRRRLVDYETFGDGPIPMLLVHGNFASSKWWRALGPLLPASLVAYAPNLPGFAGSPLGRERVTMARLAEDMIDFADALGLDRFHLVGHSLGTAVSIDLALRSPQRVASLTLLAPVPAGGMSVLMDGNRDLRRFDPRRPFNGAALHLLQAVAQWCGVHRRALERTLLRLAPSLALDPSLPLLVEDAASVTPRAIVEIFEALTHFDRRAALAGLAVPTLVIAGERDPLIPIEHARELADRLPCATLRSFAGVSHGVPLEAPRMLAKSLGRFVRFGRWWLLARRAFVLRNMTDIDYC